MQIPHDLLLIPHDLVKKVKKSLFTFYCSLITVHGLLFTDYCLMIPWLLVGWQYSNIDLWAISCNSKDTESEGTGQKSSDDQVSYFELSVTKKYSLKSQKMSQYPYPSQKKPYIVCVWNGYLFGNRSQCQGVRRIGSNRCGSYLGRTGRWTRPSIVRMDETFMRSSSTFSPSIVRMDETSMRSSSTFSPSILRMDETSMMISSTFSERWTRSSWKACRS